MNNNAMQVSNPASRALRAQAREVAPGFRWRDTYGQWLDPAHMETRHVFYTLRMIWNHTMPESAKIKPYRRYDWFHPVYTDSYFEQAIIALTAELSRRDDIRADWGEQLQWMIQWLSRHQLAHTGANDE